MSGNLSLQGSGLIIYGDSCFEEDDDGNNEYQSSECVYGNVNVDFELRRRIYDLV